MYSTEHYSIPVRESREIKVESHFIKEILGRVVFKVLLSPDLLSTFVKLKTE